MIAVDAKFVGAGLLAKAQDQAICSSLTYPVRQQAGSYTIPRSQ
jgi:hypothetical protein